jgi:outer membrane protein TolC
MGLPGARLPEQVQLAQLSTETESEMAAPDVDAWITRATDLRPDLAEADYMLKARAENILLAKGQFGPELVMQGAWGFERLDNLNYADEDQSSAVGVELRWPIFTGGFRTSQLRRARAQWWEARERLRKKRLEISSQVRRARVNVVNAQEQVRLQRMNLASAIENRRIVQKEYAAGKTSLVRLNEAQRDRIGTEVDLARARIRLRLAWSKLYSAAGYYVREGSDAGRDGHPASKPAGARRIPVEQLQTAPALSDPNR